MLFFHFNRLSMKLNKEIINSISEQFPDVWEKLIRKGSLKQLTKSDTPTAILLGGQPGAGKSFGIATIRQRFNDNIINGDEFRSYHPQYDELYRIHGKDASKYTGEFAGLMVGKIKDKAIEAGFNILIERTFRTAETPLKEVKNFKEQGYKTNVVIYTCPKEVAWQSTIHRAEEMEKASLQPRYVPREMFDNTIDNLANNVEKVFNSGLADKLEIFNRGKTII